MINDAIKKIKQNKNKKKTELKFNLMKKREDFF